MDSAFCDVDAVEDFIALFQPSEDSDGFFNSWLFDDDGLKAAF